MKLFGNVYFYVVCAAVALAAMFFIQPGESMLSKAVAQAASPLPIPPAKPDPTRSDEPEGYVPLDGCGNNDGQVEDSLDEAEGDSTGGETCDGSNGPGDGSNGNEEGGDSTGCKPCSGANSRAYSFIDNRFLSYIHYSEKHFKNADRDFKQVAYKHYIRYRDLDWQSSLGHGGFLEYDKHVVFHPDQNWCYLLDPHATHKTRYIDPDVNGVFTPLNGRGGRSLRLLNGSNQLVTSVTAAAKAELSYPNGVKETYEIVNVGSPTLSAALKDDGLQSSLPNGGVVMAGQKGVTGTGARSFAFWVNIANNGNSLEGGGTDDKLISYGEASILGNHHFEIGVNKTAFNRYQGEGAIYVKVGDKALLSGKTSVRGQWTHVAVVVPEDAKQIADIKIYVDGIQDGISETTDAPFETKQLDDIKIHHHTMKDVRYYNKAIGTNVIDALAGDSSVVAGASSAKYAGRMTSFADRRGNTMTLNYKTFTAQQLQESPSRQWQLDTITDAGGDTLTFSYEPTDYAGRWVVSQLTLPNSQSITFDYSASGFLETVTFPNGGQSTFGRGFDYRNYLTTMQIADVAAESRHRYKTAYLSSNAHVATGADNIVPQPLARIRGVMNGADELTYFNIPISGDNSYYVYEGGGKLKRVEDGKKTSYAKSYAFTRTNGAITGVQNFVADGTRELVFSSTNAHEMGTPSTVHDEFGGTTNYEYDSAGRVTKKIYSDSTTELYTYNNFGRVTRYEDRINRVTRYVYDGSGNRTQKQVGILNTGTDAAPNDVNQPEYAVYRWEYYTAAPHQNLLHKTIDPLGSEIEYIYDNNRNLIEKRGITDEVGGPVPIELYTYDSNGLLKTYSDPIGRTVTYDYDTNQRMIKESFVDGSSNRKFYGDPLTFGDGLLLKEVDRVGNVTEYFYDKAERLVKKITGRKIMAQDGTEVAVSDVNSHFVTEYAYYKQTNLIAYEVDNGQRTDYDFDLKHRLIETTRYGAQNEVLKTATIYKDNKVFAQIDPWGRRTYSSYRGSDHTLTRTVQSATDQLILNTYAEVDALTRDYSGSLVNSAYMIQEYVLNAAGEQVKAIKGDGVTDRTSYDTRGRVTQMVRNYSYFTSPTNEVIISDPKVAQKTEYDYDLNSNRIEERLPRYFDPADTNGYQQAKTNYAYTRRNLLKSTTRPLGATPAQGQPASPASDLTVYAVDGKRISYTDFNGNTTQYIWNECCGRLQAVIDPVGAVSITNNDYMGRVAHKVGVNSLDGLPPDCCGDGSDYRDPLAEHTHFEQTTRYDHLGRVLAITTWLKPLGIVDPNDVPITAAEANSRYGTAPDGQPYTDQDAITEYTSYDNNLKDGQGVDLNYAAQLAELPANYWNTNLSGVAILRTDPIGAVTVEINNGLNESVMIIDRTAKVMTRPSRRETVLASTLPASVRPYEAADGQILVTVREDVLGNVTKVYSDGLSRTLVFEDRKGNQLTSIYDLSGRVKQSRDAKNYGLDFTYDRDGRRTYLTDTLQAAERLSSSAVFNAAGQEIIETDSKSVSGSRDYDVLGRLIRKTDRLGGVTQFAYDANGNQLSITDDSGSITSYEYDSRNMRISEIYPGHNVSSQPGDVDYDKVTYVFDRANRLRKKEDQSGHVMIMDFDMASRFVKRKYYALPIGQVIDLDYISGEMINTQGGSLPDVTDQEIMNVDAVGKPLVVTSTRYDNQVSYGYDIYGRQVSETLSLDLSKARKSYTVSLAYDEFSRVASIVYPDGSKANRTYESQELWQNVGYQAVDQPQGTLQAEASIAQWTYDQYDRLDTLVYQANGMTHTATYRDDNKMTAWSVNHTTNGAMHDLSLSYAYDKNRNLITRTRAPGQGNTGMGAYSATMTHDAEDRLISYTRTGAAAELGNDSIQSQSWDLSKVHDWNGVTTNIFDNAGVSQTLNESRTHNADHSIATITADTGETPLDQTYDSRGNLTHYRVIRNGKTTMRYLEYDLSGKLRAVKVLNADDTIGDTIVEYAYDALGRRVSKTLKENAAVATELVAQWDFESAGSGTATDSGTYNLNGTLAGNAVQVAASADSIDGGYLDVTVANAYVEGPNVTPWTNETPNRTWSFWFNAKDVANTGRQFLFEEGGGTRGVALYMENGFLHMGGWNRVASESDWDGSWTSVQMSNFSIDNNEWHHVAMTLDGTEEVLPDRMKLYINGELATSTSASQLWSRNPAVFGNVNGGARHAGGSQGNGSAQFNGWLDKIKVYNRTFTQGQIMDQLLEMHEVAIWDFEIPGSTSAADTSGNNLNGTLQNGADQVPADNQSVDGGYLDLSSGGGGGNVKAPSSNLWVSQTTPQRSVMMWFKAEDIDSPTKQFLYEEGGGSRGVSIYIEDGRLYMGGWNRPSSESNWSGDFISCDLAEMGVANGAWHHVALVLDGGPTVQAGALKGYLNGQLFGNTQGSQLWSRAVACVGRVDNNTRSHDGQVNSSSQFSGLIDQVKVYSTAVSQSQIVRQVGLPSVVYAMYDQQVLAEYEPESGLVAAVARPARKYIYADNYDQPLVMLNYLNQDGSSSVSEQAYYYHHDERFNVIGLTNDSGALVEIYAYTPQGQTGILAVDGVTQRENSLVGNEYMYTGRRIDHEFSESLFHAQYFFRARYYSVPLGRFTQRDPLEYVDGYSMYAGYFASWWSTDPTGLCNAFTRFFGCTTPEEKCRARCNLKRIFSKERCRQICAKKHKPKPKEPYKPRNDFPCVPGAKKTVTMLQYTDKNIRNAPVTVSQSFNTTFTVLGISYTDTDTFSWLLPPCHTIKAYARRELICKERRISYGYDGFGSSHYVRYWAHNRWLVPNADITWIPGCKVKPTGKPGEKPCPTTEG